MLLSDAILKGCEQVPIIREQFFSFKEGHITKACALGAAALGLGIVPNNHVTTKICAVNFKQMWQDLYIHFPELGDVGVCPRCPKNDFKQDIFDVIQCLNDDHAWSREKIAMWLKDQGY